jgi:hypothetical protein
VTAPETFTTASKQPLTTGRPDMTAICVRREKAALSSACEAHPVNAPAGSNRSGHGGDEMAEAFGWSHIGDGASVWAATRVNAEQAPKRSMCRPTRLQLRGRLIRLGEMSEDDAQLLHRGGGGSTYTRKARATREAPSVVRSGMKGPTGRP